MKSNKQCIVNVATGFLPNTTIKEMVEQLTTEAKYIKNHFGRDVAIKNIRGGSSYFINSAIMQ